MIFYKTRKSLHIRIQAIFDFVSHKHVCNAMDLLRLLGLTREVA